MTAVLSVAVNVVIGTVSEVEVEGITKAVTVGAVESGRVIVTESFNEVETLPAASLAQAYRVFDPDVPNEYEVGTEDVHDPELALRVLDDSVNK